MSLLVELHPVFILSQLIIDSRSSSSSPLSVTDLILACALTFANDDISRLYSQWCTVVYRQLCTLYTVQLVEPEPGNLSIAVSSWPPTWSSHTTQHQWSTYWWDTRDWWGESWSESELIMMIKRAEDAGADSDREWSSIRISDNVPPDKRPLETWSHTSDTSVLPSLNTFRSSYTILIFITLLNLINPAQGKHNFRIMIWINSNN